MSSLNRSCEERVLQARRTLEQQTNFINDFNQKKQNRTQSIQNILSSSIQKAKQKVASLDQSRSNSSHNLPPEPKKNPESNGGSAVANAMKALQKKIADLQSLNEISEKQRKLYMKEAQSVKSQKKIILSNLQETKRSLMEAQEAIRKLNIEKQEQKRQRNKEMESPQTNQQINKLKQELKAKDKKIEQMQKQMRQKIMKLTSQPQKKKQSEMLYETKMHELKMMEDQLQKKQVQRQQENRRNIETIKMANQVRKNLQDKLAEVQSKNSTYQLQIEQMQSQLEYLKSMNQTKSISSHNENIMKLQQTKIQQLQEQNNALKAIKHKREYVNSNKMDALKDQFEELKEKYDQLFLRMKKAQEKMHKEERQGKIYRTKFTDLKEVFNEVVEKVNRMPKSISAELKLLIVKANKIDSKTKSSLRHSAIGSDSFTPSKNNRSSSIQNASISKSKSRSKSKSKNRPLKMTDLDQSRNSMRSDRSSKSKKSTSINQSGIKKTTKTNENKSIVVSSKKIEKNEISQVTRLERQIRQLRKQYKKSAQLMKNQDEKNPQVVDKLNYLAEQVQLKSEELTQAKRLVNKKY